jgi:hypothetical protein
MVDMERKVTTLNDRKRRGGMNLRPWAQHLPNWVLLAIQWCSLPLYLVLGAVLGALSGAGERFLDWRSERRELLRNIQ